MKTENMEHIELLVLENQKLKAEIEKLKLQMNDEINSGINKSRDAEKHFHNSQNEREVVSRLVKLFNIECGALKQMRDAVYKQNPFEVSPHLQYLIDNRPKNGFIDSLINKNNQKEVK